MPSGWLLCDGSAISRETYSALFDAVGTTYGTGDGSTTFNVPNLVDKFIEGATTSGTVKAAGLPNITGSFAIRGLNTDGTARANVGDTSSAFSLSGSGWGMISAGVTGAYTESKTISFSAKNSNSIYGNSSTVQPPALTMHYAIYTGNVGKHCWLRQS